MVQQEPKDVDTYGWVDKGELTELPKISLGGGEIVYIYVDRKGPKSPESFAEPALDIQIIPEDLEETAVREGIQERIQEEIHHENKEIEA